MERTVRMLVVGSVALDSVETPAGRRDEVLGGSATFFSIAASFFGRVDLVAVVGEDFPKRHLKVFSDRRIGLSGLKVAGGKTFRWKGRYHDLNNRETVYVHLNVFKDFAPVLPARLRACGIVFLANIDPDLQNGVLRQLTGPSLVACDSMDHWIAHKRKELSGFLHKVDIFLLNEYEARQFAGEENLLKAGRAILAFGPKAVVIKKGENGVLYVSRNSIFTISAYPLKEVRDPTGAGDTFAGGMIGCLSRCGTLNDANIRKAIVHGSVLASFAVEDFSVNRLLTLSMNEIRGRYKEFAGMTRF